MRAAHPVGFAYRCGPEQSTGVDVGIHYERKVSKIRRKRRIGFRARMKTSNGRKLINRKRRAGRLVNTADK